MVSPVAGSLIVITPSSRLMLPMTPAAGDGIGTWLFARPGAVSTMSLLTM